MAANLETNDPGWILTPTDSAEYDNLMYGSQTNMGLTPGTGADGSPPPPLPPWSPVCHSSPAPVPQTERAQTTHAQFYAQGQIIYPDNAQLEIWTCRCGNVNLVGINCLGCQVSKVPVVHEAETPRNTCIHEPELSNKVYSSMFDEIRCLKCDAVNEADAILCIGCAVLLTDSRAKPGEDMKLAEDHSASVTLGHTPQDDVLKMVNKQAQQRPNEDPGCPVCTFQNPLPTNFCKMCGHRLTKVGISTDYSSRRLLDPAGYQENRSVKTVPESMGGQNECDQSQYKRRDGYLDTKVSSSQHMMQGGGSKECIRCPSCEGTLRDDVKYSDRRICNRCDGNYCNKCSQPFVRNCSNPSCPLILHCHHRRTCLYMLRLYSYITLQTFLDPTGCRYASYSDWYFTMRPGRDGSRYYQTEEHLLFYKDYLINKIHQHRIDPAESMTDYDLIDLVKHGIGLDIKSWETSRKNLLEFVKTNMPL